MTEPRTPMIRDLIVRYLRSVNPDDLPIPDDYIEGVRILFDSSEAVTFDQDRTIVAETVTYDEAPEARVIIQYDPSDHVIFAAYFYDNEAIVIPKEMYS